MGVGIHHQAGFFYEWLRVRVWLLLKTQLLYRLCANVWLQAKFLKRLCVHVQRRRRGREWLAA